MADKHERITGETAVGKTANIRTEIVRQALMRAKETVAAMTVGVSREMQLIAVANIACSLLWSIAYTESFEISDLMIGLVDEMRALIATNQ